MAAERLRYQPAFDGLRALAVGAVFAYHSDLPHTKGGNLGVDVFFVLSGFLITTLLIQERVSSGRISLGAFWIRRARRLLPSLFAVCALIAVTYALDPNATQRGPTLLGAATAIVYITAWVAAAGVDLGWSIHMWSLSVEEWFYALFPLGLVVILRWLSIRWVYVLTGLAVLYTLVAANVWHWSDKRLYFGPDTRAQQLLIGCALAVLYSRMTRPVPTWLARIAVIGAMAALAISVPIGLKGFRVGGQAAIAVCAAVLVWYLISRPTGWTARVLSLAPLVWLGRRSYTFYLVHYPLFGLVTFSSSKVVTAGVVLALTLAYTALSFRYLESRFLSSRAPGGGRGRALWPLGSVRGAPPEVASQEQP
jgi:peptidoglycan/LPS O-acetylase OafA/YrhL